MPQTRRTLKRFLSLALCACLPCVVVPFALAEDEDAPKPQIQDCSAQIELARQYAYSAEENAQLEVAYAIAWQELETADDVLAEEIRAARAVVLENTQWGVCINRYGEIIPSGQPGDFLELFPGWAFPKPELLASTAECYDSRAAV